MPLPNYQNRHQGAKIVDFNDEIEASLFEEPRHKFNPPPYRQPNRYNQHHEPTDYKLKIDLPSFDGHLHIEDFLDWIHSVDNLFDYMNITDVQQVTLMA